MAKPRLLVDSCIIIEAFRAKVWKALINHFEVETVECCVTECCTGDPLNPSYVPISYEQLKADLSTVHLVDGTMLATLALQYPDLPALDPGELHLLAWLDANPSHAVITAISTADRAAVRGTHVINLMDRLSSLEELLKAAGVGRKQLESIKDHFREAWLSKLRLQLRTGVL